MMTMEDKRIRCAHCKGYHPSIAAVRACGAADNAAKTFAPVPPARPAYVTARDNQRRDAVPEGRYAIAEGDTIKFYAVTKPTEGRWSGFTFVNQEFSDEFAVAIKGQARTHVLDIIAQDPQGAMLLYGRELKHCGHCGRALRNKVSREIGIGPKCRRVMGW